MNIIKYIENKVSVEIVDILFINLGHIYELLYLYSNTVVGKYEYVHTVIKASDDVLLLVSGELELTFNKGDFNMTLNNILNAINLSDKVIRLEFINILLTLENFLKSHKIRYIDYIGKPYVYLI